MCSELATLQHIQMLLLIGIVGIDVGVGGVVHVYGLALPHIFVLVDTHPLHSVDRGVSSDGTTHYIQ